MKKIFSLILCFTFFFIFESKSQKIINEASLVYDIKIVNKRNKEIKNATYEVIIKGPLSKSILKTSLGIETNIFDAKIESGVILKEYSSQKLMIEVDKDNWSIQNKVFQNIWFANQNEEKKISGFQCKKAQSRIDSNQDLIVFYTDEIELNNNNYNIALPKLKGLPIQIEYSNGDVEYQYQLKTINYDIISLSVFDIPKNGFRILTYEQAKKINN